MPSCNVGLCARGLEGPLAGFETGVRGDEALPSASLIKVLVLAELLRRTDAGELSLEQTATVVAADLVEDSEYLARLELPAEITLRRLAEAAITVSDNAAANILIGVLGFERTNALARELGLRRTVLAREMMDLEARASGRENLTSARDAVALLEALWGGELLSPAARQVALWMLERQRQSPPLPVEPPGERFAHKPGELDDVRNVAGIVLAPGCAYAVAVLAHGEPEIALPTVEAAAREVHEVFLAGMVDGDRADITDAAGAER